MRKKNENPDLIDNNWCLEGSVFVVKHWEHCWFFFFLVSVEECGMRRPRLPLLELA